MTSRNINSGEEGAGTIEYNLFQRHNLFELYQHIWDVEDSNVLQNGKKNDSANHVIVEDSEETKRNQNNEEDNDEDNEEDNNEQNDNNFNKNGINSENNNNEDLEEVDIGEGNIAPQNEVIELRPKTNEYETDSDEDEDEDEDEN